MRIPKLKSISGAMKIYYMNIELDNKTIRELFEPSKGNKISSSCVCGLKELAREKMRERDCPVYDGKRVNTKVAFEAWGLDIADLEERYEKLKAYEKRGVRK